MTQQPLSPSWQLQPKYRLGKGRCVGPEATCWVYARLGQGPAVTCSNSREKARPTPLKEAPSP